MKNILTLLCLTLLAGPVFAASKERLKIAVYDFPPHVFVDSKHVIPEGSAIEFLNETINLDAQYDVQWVVSPFSRFLSDMNSGKADMGLFLAKTPEREKNLRFSDHAILTTESGVILPKEFPFTDLHSLKGLTLGHTQGSIEPAYMHEAGVRFDRLSGDDVVDRNLARLKLHRIDGVYVPTFSNGDYFLRKSGMQDQFKILKIPNTSIELFFVFRKDIDEKTFQNINAQLTKKRGLYSALIEKYLASPANKTGTSL